MKHLLPHFSRLGILWHFVFLSTLFLSALLPHCSRLGGACSLTLFGGLRLGKLACRERNSVAFDNDPFSV